MTAKLTADKDFTTSTDRRPAYNSGLAKVAVQCSADSFVVNQTLVLRINICGKNRHLRQAAKRYVPLIRYQLRILFNSISRVIKCKCFGFGLYDKLTNCIYA